MLVATSKFDKLGELIYSERTMSSKSSDCAKPSAYGIGHITVKDADKWAEYREKIVPTLEPWNASLIFRGNKVRVLGGEHKHSDTVVIKFPDLDSLNGWYDSAAYQAIIPLRMAAADVDLIAYESV
jgi:uncharacterized protein (DUF1330 family)